MLIINLCLILWLLFFIFFTELGLNIYDLNLAHMDSFGVDETADYALLLLSVNSFCEQIIFTLKISKQRLLIDCSKLGFVTF